MDGLTLVLHEDKRNKLLNAYFVFALLELFLLGSGQVIKYHSLTLRMLNFVLLTVFCLIFFKTQQIKKEYLIIFYVYIVTLLLSSVIGFLNGASVEAIFNDIKPLLFFTYLIPFSLLIRTIADIKQVINLIKISAIILAILYFLYLIVYQFYPVVMFALAPLIINGEIFFRANGPFLFYKGFFFIMISIFLINKQSIADIVMLLVLLLSIFFTLTRGFYLALITPFIIMVVLNIFLYKKIKVVNLILLLAFVVLFIAFLPSLLIFIGNKSASDSVRFDIINNVTEALTPLSLIFGHGFGVTAGVNRVHLEISYFEILHKQGLIGLILWFVPLIYCFKKLIKDRTENLDKRFFLAVLSVYIISLTNPIINSPLGLSTIIISIIAMDIIYKENQEIMRRKFDSAQRPNPTFGTNLSSQ